MDTKVCPQCKAEKPLEDFPRRMRRGKLAIYPWCRPCKNRKNMEVHYARTGRAPGDPKIPPGPKRTRFTVDAKKCKTCLETLPASMFTIHTQTRDGLEVACRVCMSDRSIAWAAANRDKMAERRHRQRLVTYGITQEELDGLRARSGGLCEICRKCPPTSIDHDHTTGIVRGLLCHQRNRRMGTFDDKSFMAAAVVYVAVAAAANIGEHVDVKRRRM